MFWLKRIGSGDTGTYGVITKNNIPFAVTLERQWKDNRKGESCIPTGVYTCKRVNSPKFGNTFEVTGVTGRDKILFHKGNLMDDSHGCILIGEQFEPVSGSYGIVASAKGFDEFLELTKDINEFKLYITEC